MAKYKCNFAHCQHESKELLDGEGVIVNKRHYHTDCAKIRENISMAVDLYRNCISNTAVISQVRKVINNIVIDKKVDSDYLIFALRHAITSNLEIKNPASLHYLVDNRRIKQLWEKQKKKEREKKVVTGIMQYMPTEHKETVFSVAKKQNRPKGFGDIFGGD